MMIVFVYVILTYKKGMMEKCRKLMYIMLSNAKLKKITDLSFKCITSEIVAFCERRVFNVFNVLKEGTLTEVLQASRFLPAQKNPLSNRWRLEIYSLCS